MDSVTKLPPNKFNTIINETKRVHDLFTDNVKITLSAQGEPGDIVLWNAMKTFFTRNQVAIPEYKPALIKLLENTFSSITKFNSNIHFSQKTFYFDITGKDSDTVIDHGYVTPRFWLENVIPHLADPLVPLQYLVDNDF